MRDASLLGRWMLWEVTEWVNHSKEVENRWAKASRAPSTVDNTEGGGEGEGRVASALLLSDLNLGGSLVVQAFGSPIVF